MLIRGVCIYISPVIGLVLVPYFTDTLGKKKTVISVWAFQTVFTVAPFALRLLGWFPENHTPWLLPVLCAQVIINVSLIILVGATLSSMVFDLVEDIQRTTGRREEGLLFSARSFADKAQCGFQSKSLKSNSGDLCQAWGERESRSIAQPSSLGRRED